MALKVERGLLFRSWFDKIKPNIILPDTLYNVATSAVIENFPRLRGGLDLCPENLIFDVIFEVYKR